MVRVAIVGVTGYTGAELARILFRHPQVELTALVAVVDEPAPLGSLVPAFRGRLEALVVNPGDIDIAETADYCFLATPDRVAMAAVPDLLARGVRVVDISGDFRLRDRAVYEKYYKKGPHEAAMLLGKAVYGLPEMFRDKIRGAEFVSNPGCYPTGAALAAWPLLASGEVEDDHVVVDAKTGASGAGRFPGNAFIFAETNETLFAYGVGVHKHQPEMVQVLSDGVGRPASVLFVPHLAPMTRGILSTCYMKLRRKMSAADLHGLYEEKYKAEPFVRVLAAGQLPRTGHVKMTNFCDIGVAVHEDSSTAVVVSAIDNLIKGSAGQAAQNFNLMAGFDEDEALGDIAPVP